jgi:hypothetical protein
VYVFAPANLRLKLNGTARAVPGAGTGSRRWLEVTPTRVKLAPPGLTLRRGRPSSSPEAS